MLAVAKLAGLYTMQGISETFSAIGTEHVSIYRAPMKQHDPKAELAGNMRHFCKVSFQHEQQGSDVCSSVTRWHLSCPLEVHHAASSVRKIW